jgi:phosphatidate cytidylyltransferase
MSSTLREQLLDCEHAFDDCFVGIATLCVGVILVAVPVTILFLERNGRLSAQGRVEAFRLYRSWTALVGTLLVAALLGAGPTIVAIGLLSLLCYRDYARGTGLFREKVVSAVVVLSIISITLAVLDRWYWMCVALMPLSILVLGTSALLEDRPKGFVQRVALGVLAVALFGMCLGHAGYCANRAPYRPLVVWLLASSLSHPLIAAVTRRLPGPVFLPNTSPGRTFWGDVSAILLSAGFSALLAFFAFRGTPLAAPIPLMTLGLMVGVAGQLSALMLGAVRRDLAIPDPALGRLLDRVAGLILTAPAVFHFVNYHEGIVDDRSARIFTGG